MMKIRGVKFGVIVCLVFFSIIISVNGVETVQADRRERANINTSEISISEGRDIIVGWDFEGTDNSVKDITGNNINGKILKADTAFLLEVDSPSEGWGFAKWLDLSEGETPFVYDTTRNSRVFHTDNKYEIMYDSVEFYNKFDNYSFSAWIKLGDLPYANVNPYTRSAWLFKADRKEYLDIYTGIGFDYGYAGQQSFFSPPASPNACLHTSNYALTKSQWFNMTMTIDKGVYRLYIDGKLTEIVRSGKGSDDAVTKADAGTTPIKMKTKYDIITLGGGHQTGWQFNSFFSPPNIFIDNACFYKKALNKDEIINVMNGNLTLAIEENKDEISQKNKNGCGSVSKVCGIVLAGLAVSGCFLIKGGVR